MGVLGQSIVIGNAVYTIVGVMPPRFTGVRHRSVAAWIPVSSTTQGPGTDWTRNWGSRWLEIVVRLPPNLPSSVAAEHATTAFRAAYNFRDPLEAKGRIFFAPLHYDSQGDEFTQVAVARWLFSIALLVLCKRSAGPRDQTPS
jgi:hypothetical protein